MNRYNLSNNYPAGKTSYANRVAYDRHLSQATPFITNPIKGASGMRGGGSVLKARQRRRGGTPPLALSDVPFL